MGELYMTDFAQTVDAAMGPWRLGWIVWDAAYYVTGILIIALPAIMSADLVRHERGKRILAAATAILAGVVTWVQPGTKATAHEQAYFCLRQLVAEGHSLSKRIGRRLGPLTKTASELRGSPANSTDFSRGSSSSNRMRISILAKCWPRQRWAP